MSAYSINDCECYRQYQIMEEGINNREFQILKQKIGHLENYYRSKIRVLEERIDNLERNY